MESDDDVVAHHSRRSCLCVGYDRQAISVTPTPQLVAAPAGAVGAFIDMLSRQNYIYVQPYMPATDVRAAAGGGDPSTAATGSLTDLFGRVAAVSESQDAGQVVQVTRALSSPASSMSVIVSKMGPMTPTQPVTMFRIVGGTQPHHVMAYRHRPDHADQQPVLLPARAVQPPSNRPTLAVRQRSPFAVEPAIFTHQPGRPALDGGVVSTAASCGGDGDIRRVEAEAHELTHDVSGREIHRCRLCTRIFTVMSAFRSHLLTTHCRPKNQCAVCGKHFSRSWLLKGHMRTHTGERPYRCPHVGCDRAFADKSNLRSHLLIHNANGKHYVCTRCNRAFAQKRYLHKHRLEVCKI